MNTNIAITSSNDWKPKKFQVMFSERNKKVEREMSFSEKIVRSSNTVESLGVTLDKNINFKCQSKQIKQALFTELDIF